MVEGTHYVEFTLLRLPIVDGVNRGAPHHSTYLGLVGAGFDMTGGGPASTSLEGWMLSTSVYHQNDTANGGEFRAKHPNHVLECWPRHDSMRHSVLFEYEPRIREGDVVGLMLDIGRRTLTLYINGSRQGVIVAPWIEYAYTNGDPYGECDDTLTKRVRAKQLPRSPLWWVVDVGGGSSWRIERKPPPEDEATMKAEMAAEIATSMEWQQSLERVPEPAPEWMEWLDDSGIPHGEMGE